jgi:hypothetical protein
MAANMDMPPVFGIWVKINGQSLVIMAGKSINSLFLLVYKYGGMLRQQFSLIQSNVD